jgi:hypothetical protein
MFTQHHQFANPETRTAAVRRPPNRAPVTTEYRNQPHPRQLHTSTEHKYKRSDDRSRRHVVATRERRSRRVTHPAGHGDSTTIHRVS